MERIDRTRVKQPIHRSRVDHEKVQQIARHQSAHEPAVPEESPAEHGIGFAPAVEHIEPLRDRQHRERFAADLLDGNAGAETPQKVPEHGGHGGRRHDQHPPPHHRSDQSFAARHRGPLHLASMTPLHHQIHRKHTFGHQIDPQDLHRHERQRQPGHERSQENDHLINRGREQKENHFLQIAIDEAATGDGAHDGRKVVIGNHNARRILGHVGARDAHGHSGIGTRQRGSIIYAVAGHGDDPAA